MGPTGPTGRPGNKAVPAMRAIAGEGVTLEPQMATHAGELYAVLRDPALYTFADDKEPASEQTLADRLSRLESRRSPDGTQHWLNWIVRSGDGELVGYVQATVGRGGRAEIAYIIGRHHWRRGYATAACTAMLNELATMYGVTEVVATLDPANTASLALLRKLGLTLAHEGPARQEVTYALDLISVK